MEENTRKNQGDKLHTYEKQGLVSYSKTIIIGRNEDLEKILSVSKAFDISINNKNRIQHVPDETLGVDVTIILGKDINSFPNIYEYKSQPK